MSRAKLLVFIYFYLIKPFCFFFNKLTSSLPIEKYVFEITSEIYKVNSVFSELSNIRIK